MPSDPNLGGTCLVDTGVFIAGVAQLKKIKKKKCWLSLVVCSYSVPRESTRSGLMNTWGGT